MPRHREISVKVWDDEVFGTLSKPQPNAQTLWLRLLCGPETTPIPGVLRAGRASLAEAMDWSVDDIDRCWNEIASAGIAVSDWKARLIFLPNAFKHRGPKGIPDVRGWRRVYNELPDCALKTTIGEAISAALSLSHKKIRAAWEADPAGLQSRRKAGAQAGRKARLQSNAQTEPQPDAQPTVQPKPQPLHEEEGEEGEEREEVQEHEKARVLVSRADGLHRDPQTGYVVGSAVIRAGSRSGLVAGPPASAVFACQAFHVPAFLHVEFRNRLANAQVDDPEGTLFAWYGRLRDAAVGRELSSNVVKWLRESYDLWRGVGTADSVKVPSRLRDDADLQADVARSKAYMDAVMGGGK